MIRSIWTQRFGLFLCSALVGLIVDRFAEYPWWGPAAGVVVFLIGWTALGRSLVLGPVLRLDVESIAIVRLVALALVFLIGCAVLGWLISSAPPAAG